MDFKIVGNKLSQLLNKANEQDVSPDEEEIKPEDTGEEPVEAEPEDTTTNIPDEEMGDMNSLDQGMSLPGEDVAAATTSGQIGRVYEMKKIFSRLTSLENHLSSSSDLELIELKRYVVQSIELFKVMISNLKMFMDKIDDIIITYYEFLDVVYRMLEKYYKERQKKETKN